MKPPGWLVGAEPYAVQVEAFMRSRDRDRFGLFLEQGLGKTAVDLADFMYQLHHDRVAAHIVIAPSYLASGWKAEVEKWGVPVPVFTWPQKVPERALREPYIFVIHPEAALHSGGKYVDELLPQRPHMLTVDESSMMKNHRGKWTSRIMGWRGSVAACRLLSGTPMSQSVLDLYAQLRMCGALNGVNPYQFRNRYAVVGGYLGKQVIGTKNEEELQKILASCSFRALKADWWDDMPGKVYPAPLQFAMTRDQQEMYDEMRRSFLVEIDHDRLIQADQVIHAMQKLQQISRGFAIDVERVAHDIMPPARNPALNAARHAVEMCNGKMVIFALYRHSCKLLAEALQEDFGAVSLVGGMTTDEIANVKSTFNDDPKCRVIICQEQVGARGHNLLGSDEQRCSTTMFYENSYSLELRSQAEDRNHRFGQDRAVVYIDLVGSPQDEKVILALQRKQSVVSAIIDSMRVSR